MHIYTHTYIHTKLSTYIRKYYVRVQLNAEPPPCYTSHDYAAQSAVLTPAAEQTVYTGHSDQCLSVIPLENSVHRFLIFGVFITPTVGTYFHQGDLLTSFFAGPKYPFLCHCM